MRLKWLLSFMLVIGISLGSPMTTTISALEGEDLKADREPKKYFDSITGIVQEIGPHGDTNSMKLVTLDVGNNEINRIVITSDTVVLDEFTIGSELIAFYDVNKPMILIYPPQYTAELVALTSQDRFVKVDRFDQDLVSADGMLKLNISDDTKVKLKNGKKYKGSLENCNLAVIYRSTTRSIPAQTTPDKIIVLGGPGCE